MEALGITIDGNELKIAHLQKNKDIIEVINLEKIFFRVGGGRMKPQEAAKDIEEDAFGLDADTDESAVVEDSSESEDEKLLNALTKYAKKNINIGLNITQSDMLFTNISGEGIKKEKDLKKHIQNELKKFTEEISSENYGYIKKQRDEYIGFYHNNQLDLLNQILEVKSSIDIPVRISLVDVNEISLINLFKKVPKGEDNISILLYIGNEYSRFLFFKGHELIDISQLINEGYRSDGLMMNLYGKIMLGIDAAGLEEINNLYIAGDGSINQYEEFFKKRFPDLTISPLPFGELFDFIDEKAETDADAYAIPIAIAYKLLAGKKEGLIDTNFLPEKIRKQQKTFTLGWHGVIILFLIVLSAGYFLYENMRLGSEIENEKTDIQFLEMNIEEQMPIVIKVDSLFTEIAKIEPQIALTDSLKPKDMLYSDLLFYIADSIRSLNSMWIKDLSLSQNSVMFEGEALYRTRIRRIAEKFEESSVRYMTSRPIQEHIIFNFNVTGKFPEKK